MKKRIVYSILAVFIYLTIPVSAQESSPTDDIVVKAANAVIFEMTANLKLTQDQINAIRPIVADNIAKVRNLQRSLEDGNISGSDMYGQREQLTKDEDQALSSILSADQMNIWMNMQDDEPATQSKHSSSK